MSTTAPSLEEAETLMKQFPLFVKVEKSIFDTDDSPIAEFLYHLQNKEHITNDIDLQRLLRKFKSFEEFFEYLNLTNVINL